MDSSLRRFITKRFPKGESCKDVEKRIKGFLERVKEEHQGRRVAIIAYRVPQL
ncbi:TPA: hypothetical protein HA231_00715 [Candidatus Woesearchaeota archaeon]|nr:hypothetical protein [Candidatus Woesearchaeota archaeon]